MTAGGHSIANRGTATAQAAVSAALVLPTTVIWYLRTWPAGMDWSADGFRIWSLAWTVVLGGYFVAVVAALARTSARRLPAVIMGAAATVIDVGAAAMVSFFSDSDPVLWIERVLMVVTLVLLVAAWGVARRNTPKWVIGLVPALVIAVLVTRCTRRIGCTRLSARLGSPTGRSGSEDSCWVAWPAGDLTR